MRFWLTSSVIAISSQLGACGERGTLLRGANPQGFYPLAWGRGARARRAQQQERQRLRQWEGGRGGCHKAGPRASGRGGTSGDG